MKPPVATALAGDQARSRWRERTSLLGILLALSFTLLLFPVAIAPVPPLWDYPNHLARIWLLSGGANLTPISDWYRVVWDSYTNVAVDAAAAWWARWIGWMEVGRLLVALAVVLPPLGGTLLWRSIYGRTHGWMLAFATMAWSTSLIAGFVNFQIGIGLALLAAAAEPALARGGSRVQFLGRAVAGAALIGVHLFGFIFYAGLLAGLTIGPSLANLRHRLRAVLALIIALAIPALIFVLTAPRLPGAQVGAGLPMLAADVWAGWLRAIGEPLIKLQGYFLVFFSYGYALDLVTMVTLLAVVLLSALGRRCQVHVGLLFAALGFTACYVVFPNRLSGTYWIDARFAVMASFALAAALRPDLPVASGRMAMLLLAVITCARTGVVAAIWRERQADVAAVQRVLQAAAPGRTILPVQLRPANLGEMPEGRYSVLSGSSFRHLSALALPLRHDFVPILFAARGKQPVQVQDAMLTMAEPEGGELADVDALRDPAAMARDLPFAPYLDHWRDRFDYVLEVNADISGNTGQLEDSDALSLLADAGFARLFRVTPAPSRAK